MIKVSIPSVIVRNMSGNSKSSGKPYNLDFQTVYVHTMTREGKPNPFPEKTEIILDKDDKGQALVYQPGEYQLHPASLYVDQRGSLSVAPRLAAIAAKSA